MRDWFSISLWVLLFAQVSPAQEVASLDEIETAIVAMDAIGDSHLQKRQAKYIEDLKALEAEIAKQGDLDLVLQVKKEREAWEQGKATASIDPKDNSVALGLRKLRYYFDLENGRLEGIREKAQLAEWNRIISLFVALEKHLTKAQKIEEAIEVRKAREELIKSRPVEPVPVESTESISSVQREMADEVPFRKWVETVKFVVNSGHAFCIEDGDVYLTPPGGGEKKIAAASVDERSRKIEWFLSGTIPRIIEVDKDRKGGTLHGDQEESVSIRERK